MRGGGNDEWRTASFEIEDNHVRTPHAQRVSISTSSTQWEVMNLEGNVPQTVSQHLANERTYLSWVRTCIAVFAVGLALAKFGPHVLDGWIGEAVMILALFMIIVGHRLYRKARPLLVARAKEWPRHNILAITICVCFIICEGLFLILLQNDLLFGT